MSNAVILNSANLNRTAIDGTARKIITTPNKFYLLSTSPKRKLWDIIGKLSETLKDKTALTCIRFAYNIDFELDTEIRIGDSQGGLKVRSLEELLDQLEFDENMILKYDDYHIVINDDGVPKENADKAVAKLFQQTVFLNLNIDIKKKSEIKTPLKIVVIGTKKAGKSVLINSLLKRDYVPSSSILPTPNAIKYIPADAKSDLISDYKGKSTKFDSAEDLSLFIENEFHEAQIHIGEESVLSDMIIHVPCDDLNRYEFWEIPGSNFFGYDYLRKTEECIEAADVCIFVINYSNHLTNDEVKLLNEIREILERKEKSCALVFVVNRIDERYAAEVEKSVNIILDCISGKLEELGYKNIVIFGTSALQNFYLDKVLSILKESDMKLDGNDSFLDIVRRLKKKHKEYMVPVRFIEDSLKNLEDFHSIDEPDAKILENFSGIPQLCRYLKYIAEN